MRFFLTLILPFLVLLDFVRCRLKNNEQGQTKKTTRRAVTFGGEESLSTTIDTLDEFEKNIPDSSTPQLLKECGQAQGEVLASFEASKAEAERAVKRFFYFCLSVSHLDKNVRTMMLNTERSMDFFGEDMPEEFKLVLRDIVIRNGVGTKVVLGAWMDLLSTSLEYLKDMKHENVVDVRKNTFNLPTHHFCKAKHLLLFRALKRLQADASETFWESMFEDISKLSRKLGVGAVELHEAARNWNKSVADGNNSLEGIFVASLEEAEKASAMIAVYDMIEEGDIVGFWAVADDVPWNESSMLTNRYYPSAEFEKLSEGGKREHIVNMYKKCTEVGQRVFNEIEAKMTEDR